MATAIDGLGSYDISLGKPAREPRQKLDSDAFLSLLVAQLRFQDPLKGTDQQAFMQQLATMSSMQQQFEINDQLKGLVTGEKFNQAVALIGRTVTGTDAKGETVSGQVTSVLASADGPVLKLGDQSLPFANVQRIG